MKKMLTRREVFDKVKVHLLAQGEQSLDRDGCCVYRGEGGRMCAAGCLIADAEYVDRLEGNNAREGLVEAALINSGVDMKDPLIREMVINFQRVHDGLPIETKSINRVRIQDLDNWPSILDQIEAEYFKS